MAAHDFETDATTTTQYDDVSYAAKITDEVLDALMANVVTPALLRMEDIQGFPSNSVSIPKADKFTAAAVSEGVETANTALTSDSVSGTASEIGIQATITDVLDLASIAATKGAQLNQLGRALADKMDVDICALFSGFGTSVGSTGSAAALADLLDAIYNVEVNDAGDLGPLVGVIHPLQGHNIRTEVEADSASIYTNAVGDASDGSRVLAKNMAGYHGSWMGIDLFQSTNVPTDATDRNGGVFVRDYALAMVRKYAARVEPMRWAPIRGWVLVASAMYGVFEVEDAAGVAWNTTDTP